MFIRHCRTERQNLTNSAIKAFAAKHPKDIQSGYTFKEPAMNARLPSSITQSVLQKDSTVFTSGNSQAVRIPKEFQFNTKQVRIVKRGNDLVIKPKYRTAADVLANLPPIDTENLQEWEAFDKTIRELRHEPTQDRDWQALFGDEKYVKPAAASRAGKQAKAIASPKKNRATKA
jgi:antitoxin VapB